METVWKIGTILRLDGRTVKINQVEQHPWGGVSYHYESIDNIEQKMSGTASAHNFEPIEKTTLWQDIERLKEDGHLNY